MAFGATDLDDLFLLVAWFAAGRYRTRDIVLGQYLGIGALVAASVAVAFAARAVPPDWVHWLGLVPIALGIKLFFDPDNDDDAPRTVPSGVPTVAAVTVANGADNLGVYIPLFATSGSPEIAVMAAVFAVMTGLWCLAAQALVRHPAAGAPLRRWGPKAVPWALSGIGLWIVLRG